jgi:N-acetylneuraminic acid mutarotase
MHKALGLASLLVLCATVLLDMPAAAQTHNFWTSGASVPTAVWYPAVGVLNGEIYVVGGFNSTNTAIADTQIYNPVTNTWTSGVALPTATEQASGAVVNGTLYVFGGSTNQCATVTNAVWAFNPKTKTWSSKSAMPTARCDMGVAVENKIIYVIGGYTPSGGGTRLNTVESYNPATNTWTEEAPLLNGKSEPSAGLVKRSVNGTIVQTIVAADGFIASGDNGDNEGYDAKANSWSFLKSDPNARNGACTGSAGSRLFVAGGDTGGPPGTPALSVNESFSIATNSWKTLAAMPQAAMFGGAATYKGLQYCIGGTSAYLGTVLNNVQIYHP